MSSKNLDNKLIVRDKNNMGVLTNETANYCLATQSYVIVVLAISSGSVTGISKSLCRLRLCKNKVLVKLNSVFTLN